MDGSSADDQYVHAVRRVRDRNELATAMAVTLELDLSASEVVTVRERLDRLVADRKLASGRQNWEFMASVLPSTTGETYYWLVD
jgi:hypothetical protein